MERRQGLWLSKPPAGYRRPSRTAGDGTRALCRSWSADLAAVADANLLAAGATADAMLLAEEVQLQLGTAGYRSALIRRRCGVDARVEDRHHYPLPAPRLRWVFLPVDPGLPP
jgi:hypothetical protein